MTLALAVSVICVFVTLVGAMYSLAYHASKLARAPRDEELRAAVHRAIGGYQPLPALPGPPPSPPPSGTGVVPPKPRMSGVRILREGDVRAFRPGSGDVAPWAQPAPPLLKVERPAEWPAPPAPPRPLTLRERVEVAELLDLGFTPSEIADIWRDAGLPQEPLEREIRRITGDSRPLPTPAPSHGRRVKCDVIPQPFASTIWK